MLHFIQYTRTRVLTKFRLNHTKKGNKNKSGKGIVFGSK
jgi:hypothetical protein